MVTNASGANTISGANIASGSMVVENPFILGISGVMDIYAKTDYGEIYIPASEVVIAGSEAKVRWAEKKN